MNVLFISAWYPHRYDSMFGLFVRKHAEAVSLYADVKVLYVYADDKIKDFEIIVNKHHRLEEFCVYYPISGNTFTGKIQRSINFFKAYKKGFDQIKNSGWKADITQANVFTRTAFIAYLIKLKYNIPFAVIEHWTRYFREKTFSNLLHKYVSIWVAKNASAILPVTFHLQKSMETHQMMNNNYQIINNVVDNLYFEKYKGSTSKKIKILNITCFDDEQKNISGILRTIEKISKTRNDFEIYFIGTGIDFNSIVTYSKSLNFAPNSIFFTGLLEGQELVKMYKECDFTLLFSNYENIPVVISESLACGKPVISSNVGGINEHINSENGILIEARDEKALFKATNWMLDNYKNYNAEKIIADAFEKYSYEKVGKNLTEIYKKILDK